MDDLGECLRRLLVAFAEPIQSGDDALDRIRARVAEPRRPWWQRAITRARDFDQWLLAGFASLALAPRRRNRSGAPGQGGATTKHDDDLGSHTP